MFTAAFPNGGVFLKKIIEIIKDDIPEPVFTASEEGITIQSMDKSHVALVNIFIRDNAANNYECKAKYDLGINCSVLLKILKCAPTSSVCVISYDPQISPDVIKIVFEGSTKQRFDMKLLDIDTEKVAIPDDMEHQCSVSLETEDLQNCIRNLSNFSDDVTIIRSGKNLTMEGVGDAATGSIDLTVAENFSGKLSLSYSLKYLAWFTRAASICTEATLAFDRTFPLLLHFENDIVDMRFFLAPKINENEEEMDESEEGQEQEQVPDEEDGMEEEYEEEAAV